MKHYDIYITKIDNGWIMDDGQRNRYYKDLQELTKDLLDIEQRSPTYTVVEVEYGDVGEPVKNKEVTKPDNCLNQRVVTFEKALLDTNYKWHLFNGNSIRLAPDEDSGSFVNMIVMPSDNVWNKVAKQLVEFLNNPPTIIRTGECHFSHIRYGFSHLYSVVHITGADDPNSCGYIIARILAEYEGFIVQNRERLDSIVDQLRSVLDLNKRVREAYHEKRSNNG